MIGAIWGGMQTFGLVKSFAGIAIVITLTALGYGAWHHEVYQSGVNAAIAGIAKEDARLIDRALQARAKLKDCQGLERKWDQTTGRCL